MDQSWCSQGHNCQGQGLGPKEVNINYTQYVIVKRCFKSVCSLNCTSLKNQSQSNSRSLAYYSQTVPLNLSFAGRHEVWLVVLDTRGVPWELCTFRCSLARTVPAKELLLDVGTIELTPNPVSMILTGFGVNSIVPTSNSNSYCRNVN